MPGAIPPSRSKEPMATLLLFVVSNITVFFLARWVTHRQSVDAYLDGKDAAIEGHKGGCPYEGSQRSEFWHRGYRCQMDRKRLLSTGY